MIVQEFYIPKYGDWHVKVYYAVHTYWADRIIMDLYRIGCRGDSLKRAYRNLTEGRMNTGLTYSDYRKRETVMVISLTSTPEEFQNSWDHEKVICAGISPRLSGLILMERKRNISVDMSVKRCSL